MQGRGKWEITEKTRRPAASSGTNFTCENPGVTRPESETGSSRSAHFTVNSLYEGVCAGHGIALQPFVDVAYLHNDGILQQDNVPCHRHKLSRIGSRSILESFKRLLWPLRLPDINPVKHLWNVVGRTIRTQDPAGSCGVVVTRRQLSTSLHKCFVHLWNRRHDELLAHFTVKSLYPFVNNCPSLSMCRGGVAATLPASHYGEQGSNLGEGSPGFSHAGNVAGVSVGRRRDVGQLKETPKPRVGARVIASNTEAGKQHTRKELLLNSTREPYDNRQWRNGGKCSGLQELAENVGLVDLEYWSNSISNQQRISAKVGREREVWWSEQQWGLGVSQRRSTEVCGIRAAMICGECLSARTRQLARSLSAPTITPLPPLFPLHNPPLDNPGASKNTTLSLYVDAGLAGARGTAIIMVVSDHTHLPLTPFPEARSHLRQLKPSTAPICAALNNVVLRSDEREMRREWSSAGIQGRLKREIYEKTRRRATSSGTSPTCENPGVTRTGIEPGSPWGEASSLTAQPPRPP
ncbi:hypothetical protein PR048_007794 [Dryococelus australis]|uniref:Uncharacterized protein n=1 Tax=Dryococelus australis TaxID=614101 RepID=A0ABQ9HVN4_9NEOP|nr:hypothetical protein PR048_007794 [Dryococelus australis]